MAACTHSPRQVSKAVSAASPEYIKNKEAANVYSTIGKPRILPALPLPLGEAGILLHAASICLAASDRPSQAVPTSVGSSTSQVCWAATVLTGGMLLVSVQHASAAASGNKLNSR